jgi:hypothetical protein
MVVEVGYEQNMLLYFRSFIRSFEMANLSWQLINFLGSLSAVSTGTATPTLLATQQALHNILGIRMLWADIVARVAWARFLSVDAV